MYSAVTRPNVPGFSNPTYQPPLGPGRLGGCPGGSPGIRGGMSSSKKVEVDFTEKKSKLSHNAKAGGARERTNAPPRGAHLAHGTGRG